MLSRKRSASPTPLLSDGGQAFSWERLEQTLASAYRDRFDALPITNGLPSSAVASRKPGVEEEPGPPDHARC